MGSSCRACDSERQRAHYAANREVIKQKQRDYREKNREAVNANLRRYYRENEAELKRKKKVRYYENPEKFQAQTRGVKLRSGYGITVAEYEEMAGRQGYKCVICNTHVLQLNRKLCIDHSHRTGKIRGLLCGQCNSGLGMFRDDLALLYRAIRYLDAGNPSNSHVVVEHVRVRKRKTVR